MTDGSSIHTVHKRVCHSFLQDWKAHNNAYPQKFVLTDSALTTLNQVRKLVNESIASPLQSGWEREFMGVPLEIGPANAMVGLDGTETPL